MQQWTLVVDGLLLISIGWGIYTLNGYQLRSYYSYQVWGAVSIGRHTRCNGYVRSCVIWQSG